MCDSLIKEGALHYKKQGGRAIHQKWIKRYAELYEQSAEGLPRLELYEVKEGHKKGGQKAQQTISLKSCIKITQGGQQKSQKFVIEMVFDEKTHLLAVDTQVDLELWIGDLRHIAFNEVGESFGCTKQQQSSPSTQHKRSPCSSISRNSSDVGMLENTLYSSCSVEETFHVTVRQDEFSERLKLKGEYNLVLGTQRLAVHDKTTNAVLYVWPYKFLRRYGRDRGSFSMEGGRRCEPGPGRIIFDTLQGNEIFQKVQYYVKDMSASTLNRGSTNTMPGSEESQPPLPARGYLDNHEPAEIYVNENRDLAPVQRSRVTSLETSSDRSTASSDWKKTGTNSNFLKHLDKTLQHTTPATVRGIPDGPTPLKSNSIDPVYTSVAEDNKVRLGNPPRNVGVNYSKETFIDEAYSELNINSQGPASDPPGTKKDAAKRKKELKKAELERKKLEKEREKEEKNRIKRLGKKPNPKRQPSNELIQYENPNESKAMPLHIQPEESVYEETASMCIPPTQDPNLYDILNRPVEMAVKSAANHIQVQKPANGQNYDLLDFNISKRNAKMSVPRHQHEDSTYGKLKPFGVDTSTTGGSTYDSLKLQSEEVIQVQMDESGYIAAEGKYRFKSGENVPQGSNGFENLGHDQTGLYSTAE